MKQTTKTVPTRMGLQSLWGAVERLSLTLMFIMLTTTAWAQTINGVSYIDENGETQTTDNVTVLTGNEEPSDNGTIDLTPGWYVVNSTINYTRSVTMETKGEYHIILADGGQMNIGSSANPIEDRGINSPNATLIIYGQANGTGELNVYTRDHWGFTDDIFVDDLTINGGKITAETNGDGSGLKASNNVTINGGVITARTTGSGDCFGIKAFNRVIINGGQVTAWGSNKGIYSSSGSISLSWKKITDFIDVNSYYCYSSLTIATGKVFTDGNGSYYIEANASEVLALTNTRLMPTQDYKGYSVVFDSNGGSDVPTQIVLGGFTVTEPTAPTKAGKVFCGWYLDNGLQTAYNFTSVVTGNLTLYAKWADAISYNLRDALIQRVYRYTGSVVTPVVRNNAAQLLTAGTDYKVTGATQMVQPGVYTLTVTGKGSFTGSQTVSVRVLTFDKSDGTNLVTNCTLPANNSNAVVVSSADSTMQSACWYVVSEDATVAKRISVNGDVNLVLCDGATLTAELGISVTDGNSLTIYSQSGNTGTLVAKVPDRVNVYHAAIGGDRDKFESSPVKAGTITIHGGVINADAHSLTEDIGAAHDGEAGTINIYGGKITTSGSHDTGIGGTGATVHLGWCRESSDFIESQGYSGTVVFDKNFVIDGTSIVATQKNIAGKKIVPTTKTLCTVTFQTNGGSIVDALHLFSGTTVPEPDIPFRAGYQFAGWYTNEGCTDPYDFNTAVDHSFTLYAKWDNVAPISYIDADGHTVTGFTAYTPMENSYIELPEGTYFVGKNTTVSSRIELSGTVNLILGDGATLTAEQGIHVAQHNTLNIFAQSAGTGTLTASADNHNAAIGATHEDDQMGMNHSGIIRIYGGVITANGSSGASAIGGTNVIDNGAIYIYGGKITATNEDIYGYSIGGPNATIHLDLRKASDFIHASGYMGTVNIADGKALKDASGNVYCDMLNDTQKLAIANVTLQPATHAEFMAAALPQTADNEYTISDVTGWAAFCLALQDIDTYGRFSGKTVKLGDDISVTRMAGSIDHNFMGTFDGNKKTLTFNYSGSDNYVAPFLYVENNCVIKDLHVAGTIETSGTHAAGLIANQYGNVAISNCRSSIVIKSSANGEGMHGGFVAQNHNSADLNIDGCVFDGKLLTTTATTDCGGFVGFKGDGSTLTISNSLYAPADYTLAEGETAITTGSATFARNWTMPADANCYYADALGDVQGKAVRSITAGEHVTVANAGNATEYTVSGITAYGTGIKYGSTLYAGSGEEVSLTLSNSATVPLGYQYDYTASAGTINGPANPYTLTMPDGDVVISVRVTPDPNQFAQSGDTYTIYTAGGWNVFCDALQDNTTYNRFIGKTVYLANVITVTRMAGSDKHDFCGTFDGQGNTITLDLDSNKGGYALFRNAVGATIKNLRVDGTIVTAGKYAAGLISGKWGDITIENCRSSVTIKSSVGGDGTHGGFVAVSNNGELNIKGCVFDGKIISTDASATTHCGGFVGWTNGTLNITNSLYAPAEIKSDETEVLPGPANDNPSATFCRNWSGTPVNTYYTRTLGDAQGKAAHTITAGENVSVGHAGVPTTYSVSGITAYKASGASSDDDPFIDGIVYNDVLYAGEGDEVSLTLSNSAPAPRQGYRYAGYSVTDGATIAGNETDGFTLTMPADDVTVSLALETITYTITYHLDGGSVATDNRATYNVETETFTLNNPTKAGYTFIGWTEGNDNTLMPTVTITKGSSTKDLNYTANYEFAQITQGDLSFVCTSGTEAKITACDPGATSVTIPATVSNNDGTYNVTAIEATAFSGCTGLESISVAAGNPKYHSEGNCIIETASHTLILGCKKSVIPDDVTSIGDRAFMDCESLASIEIPASVTSIGDYAFSNCTGLTSIDIPASMTSIGEGAFADCESLASVTIYAPELSYYGIGAFDNNASNRKIYVFRNCLDTYKEQASWTDVDEDDIQAITLRFYESTDNGDAIDAFAALCNGENKIDVTLQGRTLWKDGDWNTIVLPFDVTIEGSVLDGADVRALADANLTDDVLTLNFTKEGEVSKIEAGKPYIIKWKEGENLVSPVFTGVTVDATTHNFRSEDGKVYFKGTYAPLSWNAENQSILFLGAGNKLNWPLAGARLNAFRAYFQLIGEACAREFVMNFDGETTGIDSMHNSECLMLNEADAWYSLDGRKLDGKPSAKGMYIKNGKKVVVK